MSKKGRASAPPVLKLASDPLLNTTRLDLASFEAMMLFPDLEYEREQACNAALVEFGIQDLNLKAAFTEEILDISAKTLPLSVIKELAKDRFIKGMIVGYVLHNQIGYIALGDYEKSKQVLIDEATRIFQKTGKGGYLRVTKSTFNNDIWPKFRCVAHFWAACVSVNLIEGYPCGAFPCRVDALPRFLADAEAYRLMGEATRPRQGTANILDQKETVKLPDWLHIAPSELNFQPGTAG